MYVLLSLWSLRQKTDSIGSMIVLFLLSTNILSILFIVYQPFPLWSIDRQREPSTATIMDTDTANTCRTSGGDSTDTTADRARATVTASTTQLRRLSRALDDVSPLIPQPPAHPDMTPRPVATRAYVGRLGQERLEPFQHSTPRNAASNYPSPVSVLPMPRVSIATRFAHAALHTPIKDHWRNRIPSPLSEINADTDTDWRGGSLD